MSRGSALTGPTPKRWLIALALLAALITAAAVFAGSSEGHKSKKGKHSWHNNKPRKADTVFLDGKALLYEKKDRWAEAVAVRGEKISYVGNNRGARKLIGPNTEVIDLDGQMLMPGLVDGHAHGRGFVACDMGFTGGTIEEVLGKLKACLLRPDQVGMLNSNFRLTASSIYLQSLSPPGTRLTRQVLDRLSADPSEDPFGTGTTRPIRVVDSGGHEFSTNTQAIVNAGLDENTPDPPGGFIGREPNGYPNGLFADFSASWGPNPPAPPDSTYISRVQNVEEANRNGITSYLRPNGSPEDAETWKRVADNGELTIRVGQALGAGALRGESDPAAINAFLDGIDAVRTQYNGYESPNSPGQLFVDTVKIFCDGVAEFPSQTAAFLKPYNVNVGTPENPIWQPGTLRGEDPSCEDAKAGFVELDDRKWSIHIHSLGNRSARVALDNFAAGRKANGRWDSRHTITHLEFVTRKDMPRFGKLGVVANMTLNWAGRDSYTVDSVEGHLDPDVMDTIYPARGLQRGGAVMAGGSDWPVTQLLPWRQIEMGITREYLPADPAVEYEGPLNYKERLSRLDSLKMHSRGAAWQMHLNSGKIKEGMLADLIVPSQNVMRVPVNDIELTKVFLTMLGGQVVWEDPANPVRTP
jgi:predicted amidohydrolase YtcJ